MIQEFLNSCRLVLLPFYAKHEGVLLRIKGEQDIEHAIPIVRQAYSLAASEVEVS